MVFNLVDEVVVAVRVVELAAEGIANVTKSVVLPADEDVARRAVGKVVDGVLARESERKGSAFQRCM